MKRKSTLYKFKMSATGRRGQGEADVVTFVTIRSDIKYKLQFITRKITFYKLKMSASGWRG